MRGRCWAAGGRVNVEVTNVERLYVMDLLLLALRVHVQHFVERIGAVRRIAIGSPEGATTSVIRGSVCNDQLRAAAFAMRAKQAPSEECDQREEKHETSAGDHSGARADGRARIAVPLGAIRHAAIPTLHAVSLGDKPTRELEPRPVMLRLF